MSQHWDEGVDLELHGIGKYRTVKSTEDAAESLVNHWPRQSGPAWIKAQRKCLRALEGRITARKARDAFIRAAQEAEIYIRKK
jgi:hypothetical protein